MKFLKHLCLITFLVAQTAAGQESSLFAGEHYRANQMVYALGLGRSSESTNLYAWTVPSFFVSENGETNMVVAETSFSADDVVRTGISYSSVSRSGEACIYTCTNHLGALRELLLPAIVFSSSTISAHTNKFVVSTTDFGAVLIFEKDSNGNVNQNSCRFCMGNVAVFVEGDKPLPTALFILRAGGVDIPEESESSEQSPE